MKLRMWVVSCVLLVGGTGSGTAQVSRGTEIAGIIDVHFHVGPATVQSIDRALDAIEAAQIAERHGMRAVVFKQHYLETASWAYLVSRMVPGIQLFGGIALNRSVGGLNPVAVENVATFPRGVGKVVYMPTLNRSTTTPVPQSPCRSRRMGSCCRKSTTCSTWWRSTISACRLDTRVRRSR